MPAGITGKRNWDLSDPNFSIRYSARLGYYIQKLPLMVKDNDIEILREAAAEGRIHWHQHALERFLERGISRAEVVRAIY